MRSCLAAPENEPVSTTRRVPPSQSTDPWSFLRKMHVIARSGLGDLQGTDNLSTVGKPKEKIMNVDSLGTDPFGHSDLAVKNVGIRNVARSRRGASATVPRR